MNNPLSEIEKNNRLPLFSKIKAKHIKTTIVNVIEANKSAINELSSKGGDVKQTLSILQEHKNKLSKIWSTVSHLNSVVNNDELRNVYNECLPLVSEYHTEMGQHKGLFELLGGNKEKGSTLSSVERKIVDNLLENFRLSGVALSLEQQLEYKQITSEISKLSANFADNVLDATNAWKKTISRIEDLQGLPDSAVALTKTIAEKRNNSDNTWLLTLDYPIFNAVMTYADNRELRKEIYLAFTTRASDQGQDISLDNSEIMEKIISLRTKRAKLLGFSNYAEQSLHLKMADSPDQVITFLSELLEKTKPQAEREMRQLVTFAREELQIIDIQAWDITYVREKLQHQQLDYSEEDVKPWFSVETVLSGLFELIEILYDCTIVHKRGVDVWHDDVRFYEVYDNSHKLKACFYLDLYARQHKRGGAWMASYCGRYTSKDNAQIPVAFLTCNSSTPTKETPALFTHQEVITIFHEFGHGLHHMLTEVDYLEVSGLNGVEWDAVELPSQFMENWCWQRKSLDLFAKHYQTKQPIPKELFEKITQTRHYYSGLDMLRQLEFAMFDMRLHMDDKIETYQQISDLLVEVRKETALLPIPATNRFQNSFSHIFSGGYAAGYYSYKWAEVLSADAFSKFEETGLFNKETSHLFLKEILAIGGSRSARKSFEAFRGRDPDNSALLRHSGIVG